MDAKTRDLGLLAALSLFLASFAWAMDDDIFSGAFCALAAAAAFGIAWERWR